MSDVWEAPKPGSWMRDDVHFQTTMSRYLAALFPPAFEEGWREGFARYGLPLEALEPAIVGGRLFARVKPVGAPEPKPGKTAAPPPRIVMRLLFAVHPELRRRRRAAEATLASRRWRSDRETWRSSLEPSLRARCLDAQAIDPSALDDDGLADHLARLERTFHDGNVTHFAQNPASGIPVGDFVNQVAGWTGADMAEIVAALQGHSPTSARPRRLLDDVAAGVMATTGLAAAIADESVDPADRLELIRAAGGDAPAALDAYLSEYGHRIVTGFDVTDRTLLELPSVVIASIVARTTAADGVDEQIAAQAETAADHLRNRVPAEHRSEFDQLLDEARAGYALHDEDVGCCFTWPLGLIRRALLAAASRLHERGAVADAMHVFEAEPAEVARLLRGDAGAPAAADLAARATERERLGELTPPDHLGPDAAMPDPSLFPAPVARITAALMTYISDANLPRSALDGSPNAIAGVGGSPGVYVGRACVLDGPDQFAKLQPGDVLIAAVTSPAYNAVLPLLGAVVTNKGGALCHAAIVAREFGIPAVVGTQSATTAIPDGAKIRVDGTTGSVTILG